MKNTVPTTLPRSAEVTEVGVLLDVIEAGEPSVGVDQRRIEQRDLEDELGRRDVVVDEDGARRVGGQEGAGVAELHGAQQRAGRAGGEVAGARGPRKRDDLDPVEKRRITGIRPIVIGVGEAEGELRVARQRRRVDAEDGSDERGRAGKDGGVREPDYPPASVGEW
jgi:hypothetical protein